MCTAMLRYLFQMSGHQKTTFMNKKKLVYMYTMDKLCSRLTTIYALSSGYGKCGVAVIRISGPKACEAIDKIAGMHVLPLPRQAVLRKLRDPVTNDTLDRGIVIWFPGPKSFTGEDSCEFQIHGGLAVITGVLEALGKLRGFRPAEPGEFTRRAFHSGKLDLTEVEGLADLIQAETETQRKQAFLQMEGTLSRLYNSWRQILLQSVAHLEAYIDFSEDENIEDDVMIKVNASLQALKMKIENHLCSGKCGERLRDGVRTVIVGEPNVGKSSMLNMLCERPAAIVTPVAGTTRDVVELHMNVGGYPVVLADTAGLHDGTQDEVEREGMIRAKTYAQKADLLILVLDAAKYAAPFESFINDHIHTLGLQDIFFNSERSSEIKGATNNKVIPARNCLVILNKIDLIPDSSYIETSASVYSNVVTLSCKTQHGLPQVLNKMTQQLVQLCGNPSQENPSLTQARHRHHLSSCLTSLEQYFQLANADADMVLAAQQLRNALRHVGKITGYVSTDQILDVIFKDFCIGK